MRFVILTCLLIGALPAAADQWASLHWETINVASCNVAEEIIYDFNSPRPTQTSYWRAKAYGTRENGSEWKLALGEFPDTDKGFDQASHLCHEFTRRALKELKKHAPPAPKQ